MIGIVDVDGLHAVLFTDKKHVLLMDGDGIFTIPSWNLKGPPWLGTPQAAVILPWC